MLWITNRLISVSLGLLSKFGDFTSFMSLTKPCLFILKISEHEVIKFAYTFDNLKNDILMLFIIFSITLL